MAFAMKSSGNYNLGRLIPAILALAVSVIFSFVHVNIAGQAITLTWLPLLVVAFWPRASQPFVSILIFLAMGLVNDWGSAGAPGQWALVYLAVFAVLRPDRRGNALSLGRACINWGQAIVIGIIIFTLTGRFSYGVWPDFKILMLQVSLVTLLLPIIFAMRKGTSYVLTDPYDRDF